MNAAEFKRIIQNQEIERNKILSEPGIIPREINIDHIKKLLLYPNALVILGVRRSGKSTLSWLIMDKNRYAYINFDDEALYGIKSSDLDMLLKAFYDLYGSSVEYFVFDEIQNVEGWELFVNRLIRTKKVIITRSNSNLLSRDLATHLTGRHSDITVFPFSFREFLRYKGIDYKDIIIRGYSTEVSAQILKLLAEFMKFGGFPESYKFGLERAKSIFGDIVSKDVIRRYSIKNIKSIEELAKYLIYNFSAEMTFSKLRNISGIKKIETVKNYVNYLTNSYLIFYLERFSFKLKQRIISPKKTYCIDTGIINSIISVSSDNLGKIMENVVAVELLRRKAYSDNYDIFYWKDASQREIDFLIKREKSVEQLIQVTYSSSREETNNREINNLITASKELRCNNLLIITWDYEAEEKIEEKKIRFIPLWRWLLT